MKHPTALHSKKVEVHLSVGDQYHSTASYDFLSQALRALSRGSYGRYTGAIIEVLCRATHTATRTAVTPWIVEAAASNVQQHFGPKVDNKTCQPPPPVTELERRVIRMALLSRATRS